MATPLQEKITQAVREGRLLDESARNIAFLLEFSSDPVYARSVEELVDDSQWQELNDRFYKKLAFGTGGLRSRTIGRIVTRAERGAAGEKDRPEHPCVGTNAMNYYNVSRATQGLVRYGFRWMKQNDVPGRPSIAIAHDTRHFSRAFAEFCARLCRELGVDVFLMEGPRSTPQLSFAVRHFEATCGVMLTASHNPPHDNGYKVYFHDGAQIIDPHASGIVEEVNAIEDVSHTPLPENRQGSLTVVGKAFDEIYLAKLQTLMLQPNLLEKAKGLKIVYTNLHGVGGVIIEPILEKLGFDYLTVEEQDTHNGDFPTVKSPNPEESPALKMAMDLAEKTSSDIVIGTDPDCDRMGVAARNRQGVLVLLSGNQIGSLLAHYRSKTFLDLGLIPKEQRGNATLIKTFVTTNLQEEIAKFFGIRCVNTLTGFKYIGAKLTKYERQVRLPPGRLYKDLSEAESRRLRLEQSLFFVFGGEESYGYSGSDFVRDKDGNGAVVMFCELAAYAKSRGLTVPDLLDEMYQSLGYFEERLKSVVLEGAEGAAKIQKLADSYTARPPKEVDGSPVVSLRNFAAEDFVDEEGDPIPEEKMIIVEMQDGRRFAVRPSGTEPKIKYYLFSQNPGSFTSDEIAALKARAGQGLENLWTFLERDIQARLDS